MCGIFGALTPLPEPARARVGAALRHRGPDEGGAWAAGDVVLLHRRLKIIDLSAAGAQPMANEDGAVQVVFNGEIYNHHDLRRELRAAGHEFRGRADTEVIVHGYEQWGDDVVLRLDGMFAFGLWDARRRRLLLARDRVGKKPLFYTTTGPFCFASTVAALHAAGAPREVAVAALPYYLAYGFVPPPATLHAGIRQLPPASRLVLEPGAAPRVECYYSPRFAPTCHDDFEGAARTVRALVTRAVERRLESDVPLGAFLSGGIDSTIIVGVMARLLGQRVRTFSIGFAGDPRYDETDYARLAARTFGTDHTEFTLTPASFELAAELVRHHDGPFGDSSAIPTYVVSQLTRQHVTVALTGDGGDELFCGYLRFLAAEIAEGLPLLARRAGSRLLEALPGESRERSLLGRGRRFLAAASLPLADRMAHWNSLFDPRAVLRPEVAARLGAAVAAPLEWQRGVLAECRGTTTLARVLEHNYRTYLPCDLLVKADRTSMAHALELRSPFLDAALLEYAATLPASYLRRGLETKRVLKHAFRDLLPERIRRRGKMGFALPLGTWFRGDLKGYLRDHLGPGARLDEYLEPRAVARLLDDHARGAADHSHRLWALLTLELWLRARDREAA